MRARAIAFVIFVIAITLALAALLAAILQPPLPYKPAPLTLNGVSRDVAVKAQSGTRNQWLLRHEVGDR